MAAIIISGFAPEYLAAPHGVTRLRWPDYSFIWVGSQVTMPGTK
jgi:hypothetical protein